MNDTKTTFTLVSVTNLCRAFYMASDQNVLRMHD